MRSFTTFTEARNEIRRDLNELGKTVFAGYQSKSVTDDQREALTTKELENYDYVVLRPNLDDLAPTQPWATDEWLERRHGLSGMPLNPGEAWQLRREVWEPLLEEDGRFSYTYSERLARAGIRDFLGAFMENPSSRQLYVSIWDPTIDGPRLGKRRVPCTLGYHLIYREGRLDMTYQMRSNDFGTHWENDCWLALQLQLWIANHLNQPVGRFTQVVSSMHVYAADVAGVF